MANTYRSDPFATKNKLFTTKTNPLKWISPDPEELFQIKGKLQKKDN
jgi:hypothetical protein